MTLDPAGLEAAAKALSRDEGIALWDEWTPAAQGELLAAAESCVRAYLAAVPVQMPGAAGTCPECSTPLDPLPPIAVVPVTPTTENPYRGQPLYLEKCVVWDEGWAAGRAAATPDPPDEAAIRADERERLSARVYENGWCPTCGTKTADPGVIPGPDPGACPACGGWRKAGMIHRCPPGATPEDERARIGAEERKRITDLLRDGAARRELRANRPGNAAATTLMASWEALRLAADVIERSAGSAGSDGEDR